ncbi:MAG: hypothetical protein CVU89_03440 [Firmicutes bacterium HGW-Firmicutes-14]|nr:MAG: hypothetical protein CVU89_03440 [Firmicutes bacterium HGW-Firmicutes-14]
MAVSIDEILNRISSGYYGPRYKTAAERVKDIAATQNEQRTSPLKQSLELVGKDYMAVNPEEQRAKNEKANMLRKKWLEESGGDPSGLSRDLWGANPDKGFQVGPDEFVLPGVNPDYGLTLGQKRANAPLTGMFEGKPTFERTIQEAGLTGRYGGELTFPAAIEMAGLSGYYNDPITGQRMPTFDREMSTAQLAIQRANAARGGGSGYTMGQRTDDLFKIWEISGKAPAGLEHLGVSAGTSWGGSTGNKDVTGTKVETYYKNELPMNFQKRGKGIDDYAQYLKIPQVAEKIINDIGINEYRKLLSWVDTEVEAARSYY